MVEYLRGQWHDQLLWVCVLTRGESNDVKDIFLQGTGTCSRLFSFVFCENIVTFCYKTGDGQYFQIDNCKWGFVAWNY